MRIKVQNVLIVFIGKSNQFKVLSTIARLSGGIYDELPGIFQNWKTYKGDYYRFNDPFNKGKESEIIKNYLTPLLLCGKPESIDMRRWFIKSLSNDQTAFTGFTSLVDVVESENLGYDGTIRLLPSASFIEPFALKTLDQPNKNKLIKIQEKLNELDSTQVEEISRLIKDAECICPVGKERKKGKSPIFFYGISDKPFNIPRKLYDRLETAAEIVYNSINSATEKWNIRLKNQKNNRNIFTGSIDFMISEDYIYVIDIGTPAIGYIADLVATNKALNRKVDFGIEKIVSSLGDSITISRNRLSKELGFFKLEKEYLIEALKQNGINVNEIDDEESEVSVNNEKLPNLAWDYISRNQILRNEILKANRQLSVLKTKIPEGFIAQPDDFYLTRFYDKIKLGKEDYGLIVKKKVLFKEYEIGNNYFKPLVIPIWSRELKTDKGKTNLFEQFIPSLIETDIAGDKKGKRCYEIRMYFVAGNSK